MFLWSVFNFGLGGFGLLYEEDEEQPDDKSYPLLQKMSFLTHVNDSLDEEWDGDSDSAYRNGDSRSSSDKTAVPSSPATTTPAIPDGTTLPSALTPIISKKNHSPNTRSVADVPVISSVICLQDEESFGPMYPFLWTSDGTTPLPAHIRHAISPSLDYEMGHSHLNCVLLIRRIRPESKEYFKSFIRRMPICNNNREFERFSRRLYRTCRMLGKLLVDEGALSQDQERGDVEETIVEEGVPSQDGDLVGGHLPKESSERKEIWRLANLTEERYDCAAGIGE
ncbi:hypothetical protein BDQ12DRAFT_714715 [Crucibulum laeve]|uniref:Uncharacterized protein n=1 Tax=Crucibulum laeve TaxID=68775 RepID=A0A5C3LSY3_9AGAR|nr:hypothetical protein BDQ12DRAFT_714715 [Crucibulum laeve]